VRGTQPQRLAPNVISRAVLGGPSIASFRGIADVGDYNGEDWVGSVTTARGQAETGLSRLANGTLLRDAIDAEPELYLGAEHVASFGSQTGVLVKLLDAGERLMVHAHPSSAFAHQHVGSRFGKTEGWIVLGTSSPDAAVHVGFRKDVDAGTLAAWVDEQRTDELLAALNRIPVSVGDALYVPAGIPHSIGAGVFLIEVQEPTDLSVILEWEGFAIDAPRVGHLTLGYPTALLAVDRSAWSQSRLSGLRAEAPAEPVRQLFPPAASPYFGAARIDGRDGAELPPSFAIVVVLEGDGELRCDGLSTPIARGDSWLVPYAAGATSLHGDVVAVRCVPPATAPAT
jgi:mannose-6-phosphate isomerase